MDGWVSRGTGEVNEWMKMGGWMDKWDREMDDGWMYKWIDGWIEG